MGIVENTPVKNCWTEPQDLFTSRRLVPRVVDRKSWKLKHFPSESTIVTTGRRLILWFVVWVRESRYTNFCHWRGFTNPPIAVYELWTKSTTHGLPSKPSSLTSNFSKCQSNPRVVTTDRGFLPRSVEWSCGHWQPFFRKISSDFKIRISRSLQLRPSPHNVQRLFSCSPLNSSMIIYGLLSNAFKKCFNDLKDINWCCYTCFHSQLH